MLIVEGPDNSGKSTLVRRLAEEAKLLLIANKRKPKTKSQIFEFMNLAIPLSHRFPTIFDRWSPISEAVYGPIIRGHSILSFHDEEVARAAPILSGLSPMIIYCRPDDDTIKESLGDRGQMPGVEENIDDLILSYDQVINHWAHAPNVSYPTVRYNYRDPGAYEYILERVTFHINGVRA